MLAFECGMGQAPQVEEILRENGYEDIRILRDFTGVERVVTGVRTPPEKV